MIADVRGRFAVTVNTPGSLAERMSVFVDGQPIRGAIAFDTRESWVQAIARDDAGKPLIVRGQAQYKTIRGAVRCVIRDPLPVHEAWLTDRGLALA
jgi:hypothetical protein